MQVKFRNIRKTKCRSRGSDYTEKQVCKSQINIFRRSVHSKKKKKKKKGSNIKVSKLARNDYWYFKSSCKGGCLKVRKFLQIVSANM